MTFSQRGLKERRRNHWNIWHTDQALSGTHNCPGEVTRYSLSLVPVLPRRWEKWLLSEENLYFTILVATGHKENIVFNRLNRKFQEAILIGHDWVTCHLWCPVGLGLDILTLQALRPCSSFWHEAQTLWKEVNSEIFSLLAFYKE